MPTLSVLEPDEWLEPRQPFPVRSLLDVQLGQVHKRIGSSLGRGGLVGYGCGCQKNISHVGTLIALGRAAYECRLDQFLVVTWRQQELTNADRLERLSCRHRCRKSFLLGRRGRRLGYCLFLFYGRLGQTLRLFGSSTACLHHLIRNGMQTKTGSATREPTRGNNSKRRQQPSSSAEKLKTARYPCNFLPRTLSQGSSTHREVETLVTDQE